MWTQNMYKKCGLKICTRNVDTKYVQKMWTQNMYEKCGHKLCTKVCTDVHKILHMYAKYVYIYTMFVQMFKYVHMYTKYCIQNMYTKEFMKIDKN